MTDKCQATTNKGTPCTYNAREGTDFCGVHSSDKVGRRHTLETDEGKERVAKLFQLLETGVPIGASCDVVGLGESTVHLWRTEGEEARAKQDSGEDLTPREQTLLEFLREFTRARGASVRSLTLDIRKAAAGRHIRREYTKHNDDGSVTQGKEYFPADWRAADRLLVISHGLGTTTKIEHSGPGGGPIETKSETTHDMSEIDFLKVGEIMQEIGALDVEQDE